MTESASSTPSSGGGWTPISRFFGNFKTNVVNAFPFKRTVDNIDKTSETAQETLKSFNDTSKFARVALAVFIGGMFGGLLGGSLATITGRKHIAPFGALGGLAGALTGVVGFDYMQFRNNQIEETKNINQGGEEKNVASTSTEKTLVATNEVTSPNISFKAYLQNRYNYIRGQSVKTEMPAASDDNKDA